MNRKTTLAEKLRNFVEGKGFYLVVLVCVAAIGISSWYLYQSVSTDGVTDNPGNSLMEANAGVPEREDGEEVSGRAELYLPPETPALSQEPVLEPEPSMELETAVSEQPPETPAVQEEPQEPVSEEVPLVYTWPVKGEILTGYSMEALAYDETMKDWRIHGGIDIAAPQGTNVLAAAAGTVVAVDQDDLMGTTIVIDHGQGMMSAYSNLQAIPTVEAGDSVYTGTVIGAVGSTALAESAKDSHLHFEMTKDTEAVNPLDYLPELP